MAQFPVADVQSFFEEDKWVGDFEIDLGDGAEVESWCADEVYNGRAWPVRIWARFRETPFLLRIAVRIESEHLARYDSDEHKKIRPHLHHYDGTVQMHKNVTSVPITMQSPTVENLPEIFRGALTYWNIGFSSVVVHRHGMRLL